MSKSDLQLGSVTGEAVMQRLRYFENLAEHLLEHNAQLEALLRRSGIGVPLMPHFEPLVGPLGNYDPNEAAVEAAATVGAPAAAAKEEPEEVGETEEQEKDEEEELDTF